ncbi:MAG: urea transporter [Bacteroidetes bacterium]|nr:urea transporter [Bacteroidota bacterium]
MNLKYIVHKLKSIFPSFLSSIANSYSQIFFSNSKTFALILFIVSFFDFWAGLSGVIAVMVSNILAYLIGFNRVSIRKGYYGFNSLLVGLGLGVYFQPGPAFFIVLFFAALLTLLITLLLEGVVGKYGLPFMSMSFLLGTWAVSLATRQFTALHVGERGIFMTNEMFSMGGHDMVASYNWLTNLGIHESVRLYFTSLGAIFFQYHLFAGVLVAVGLLIYSRIAFVLSLVGFFSAYVYYHFIGADIRELSYSYIGFNFILTSIAIGGFFIIPSRWSFLWVILLTPLISIILTSTQMVFSMFQLSVYSLPFNLIVLLFLYSLKFRERFFDKPELVSYQQYSPEKNLYAHLNYRARFGKALYFPFTLPFWGEWKVSQGHSGKLTHTGDWRHAWDFEITDEKGKTYEGSGNDREDYYGYNKPVLAPADGCVEELVDGVDENEIGDVDLEHNWGNTIILRHADQLFSKLSHLKNGSFKVAAGDAVKKGQVVASCGNSGRSPFPHIHFQIQSTPYIGSKTLDYPISHYINHKKGTFELTSWEKPGTDVIVSNVSKNSSMEKAFHFIPGQKLSLIVYPGSENEYTLTWEVEISAINTSCIYCEKTKSRAWFRNDGDIHYFTHFEGDRSSLLFRFFLGAYKVMMGYYPGLLVKDSYPIYTFSNPILGLLQDFVAPFFLFISSEYSMNYTRMEDEVMQTGIRLKSLASAKVGRREVKRMECELFIGAHGLQEFVIKENNITTQVKLASPDDI